MAPDDRLARFDDDLRSGTHLRTTLGYRRLAWAEGSTTIAWDATPEYGFPTAGGTGTVRATGTVGPRTRRIGFCEARLVDADDALLAVSRCTQVVLPAEGRAGRYDERPTARRPRTPAADRVIRATRRGRRAQRHYGWGVRPVPPMDWNGCRS